LSSGEQHCVFEALIACCVTGAPHHAIMAAKTQRHTDLLRVDWEQRGDRSLAFADTDVTRPPWLAWRGPCLIRNGKKRIRFGRSADGIHDPSQRDLLQRRPWIPTHLCSGCWASARHVRHQVRMRSNVAAHTAMTSTTSQWQSWSCVGRGVSEPRRPHCDGDRGSTSVMAQALHAPARRRLSELPAKRPYESDLGVDLL
jgi:hypothetical protein